MIKNSTASGNWIILDTNRSDFNIADDTLYANLSNADAVDSVLDINSNGFKLRSINGTRNTNGATYIYAAFAENPFKYARAR